jgi:glycosyltransferase involved in cell wall biosynthesis
MHIALYSPAWPLKTNQSGIVTYVHWMRLELLKRGHRVSVFSSWVTGGSESGVYPVPSVPHTRLYLSWRRLLGEKPSPVSWSENLAREVAKVHATDPIDVLEMEESFGWFRALILQRRFPVVVKLHGPAFLSLVDEDRESETGKQRILAEGIALKHAATVTAPSRCTLAATLARYDLAPACRAHIVNPLELGPGAQLWSSSSARRNTLLFVGRFDKLKGGDQVLMAFKKLLKLRPDVRLVFVGPDEGLTTQGGQRVHFAEFANALLTDSERSRLEYLGAQAPDVVQRLRVEASLTIVASRWESQGYTALEAMLQGCPVVSSDTSGLSESIVHGQTGLLFKVDDVDDMVLKICLLLDDPALGAGLGRSAREYVLRVHGLAQVVDQTLEVYRSATAVFRGTGALASV